MEKSGVKEIRNELKKEHKIIIALSAVIVCLIVLCFYLYLANRPLTSSPSEAYDCKSIENSFLKDACFTNLAMSSGEVEGCQYVISLNQKDLCYIELSKIKKDKSVCNSVADVYYSKPKCIAELQMLGVK